jgi:CRISPR-associated endonuclease Csn1
MGSYTLGLDIGSNSVGWALIDGGEKPAIVGMGVRVFPEGVDRDTKGLEKSKNATRREARGSRRIHTRRNLRRDQLIETLRSAGLLPPTQEELNELLKADPYQLRAKGVSEKLTLHDFGRALFHINQRRGFKSNRKTGKAKEDGVVRTATSGLRKAIDDSGCRTLGEYLATLDTDEQRIRDRYTLRSMYEEEFDLLWEKQSEFCPEILTESLRKKIRDEIILYQRPLKPTDDLIGECDLEQGEKRCPRGDWYARRFRLLQDVNNLRIYDPECSEPSGLTDQQRQTLLEELGRKDKMSFDAIRKKLGLLENQQFNFEEDGKVKNMKGDTFSFAMRSRKLFGPKVWDGMDQQEKVDLNDAVLELDDDELAEKMVSEYSFSQEQVDQVLKVPLPQRYMSFSRKAIRKLLPFMEQGLTTTQAIEEAGYNKKAAEQQQVLDKLPLPDDLRNPIVNKALFEVRKVVNSLIREYSKPDKVVIEMARDVKGSKRERDEIQYKMRENKKRNEQARNRLINDIGISDPTRNDIIKYKLWEECGKVCPYTGKTISQTDLFTNGLFQVEHILPYSRSLDDSYMNKTLCCVNENRMIKGNRTPYEAYSHDPEKYEQLKQRIACLPWPKRRKFLQKEIDLDECISRELNDTRYICKQAIKYIGQLGVTVTGTKGRVTAELRHQWGLNSILNLTSPEMKNRDDHRHHAIDAAVVALTRPRHLKKLASTKYSKVDSGFPEPWPEFRQQVEHSVRQVNACHRVTRKVSGPLHEETSYGLTEEVIAFFQKGRMERTSENTLLCKNKLNYVYARTPSDILKRVGDLDQITDDAKNVKDAIRRRLTEHGISVFDSKARIPKDVFKKGISIQSKDGKDIPVKKIRVHVPKSNMIILTDRHGQPYRAVEPGSNHHIEIFEYTDKRGNVKRGGHVVSMFEAVQRNRKGERVVQRDHGPGKKSICSLARNDMFMLETDDGSKVLHRVQKLTQSGTIVLRPHTYAGKLSDYDKPPLIQRRSPNTLKGHKVTVDPLGRIWPANY